jgi:hypothetical protein
MFASAGLNREGEVYLGSWVLGYKLGVYSAQGVGMHVQ